MDDLKKQFEEEMKLINLRYYIAKTTTAVAFITIAFAAISFLFSFL